MTKRFSVFFMIIVLSVLFAGCGDENAHKHSWIPQTCTEPLICTTCGATKGEPWGHRFKDATCSEPSTCILCGETQGEALGHKYAGASYITPETCYVCGEQNDVYLKPSVEVIAVFDSLAGASENCLIYEENSKYGILSLDGKRISDAEYDGYITELENDCFALVKNEDFLDYYFLFSNEGELLWTTTSEYEDFDICGLSGGFLLLHNDYEHTYYYLDANNGFSPVAYVDASFQGKEKFSLANFGVASASNEAGIGYPYISLSDMAYVTGELEDGSIIDAVGNPVNAGGELLASLWTKDRDGKYSFDSLGFFNVITEEYVSVEGWYDDSFLMKHIENVDGKGINRYDTYDGLVLLQSGVCKKADADKENESVSGNDVFIPFDPENVSEPIFNLYDYYSKSFVTEYGLYGLIIGNYRDIGIVKSEDEYYYTFLDPMYMPVGDLYDGLTELSVNGLGLALKDGKAYVINYNLAAISDPIKATSVWHRFDGYYIVGTDEGDMLVNVK